MHKHILLPISNPKNAEYTLKAALRLLDNEGTLILLGVLLARESYPDRNKNYLDKVNLIMRLMQLAQRFNVEAVPEITEASSVYDAIVQQIAKHDADLTMLGYSLQSTLHKIRHGDIIYPIMKNAKCDVILSNLKYDSPFERILVPSAGYKHSIAALKIAATLAEPTRGKITLLHIAEANESEVLDDLKRLASANERVSVEVRSGPIAEQIIAIAKDYDALVMGASERPRSASVVFGTVVDKVIESAQSNILVVRA
ncbi:MAG: universal stress protein [Halobacteriota archaeon]|jgi:nucleotide-binding universal stress UspA family protein